MMKRLLCLSVIVQALLLPVICDEYLVPNPRIKVLSPRGFRVSIPHEDGIELFAFHANINRPMDGLEAGQFSKDILLPKKNRWVFQDRRTMLKPGDVIYYWLFVIKNKLGYRYDNGKFVVQAISPDSTEMSSQQSPSRDSIEDSENNTTDVDADCRCRLDLNITGKVDDLAAEVEKLRKKSGVLQDLLEKSQFLSSKMKFEGILPPYEDATYAAQVIIDEKLGIPVNVVSANRNSKNSITFLLANLDDKIAVIKASEEKLVNSKIKLVY